MIDNRDRWKANISADLTVMQGVMVTPTFKYQDDHYGLNGTTELGLTDSRSWAGGVDLTFTSEPRHCHYGWLRAGVLHAVAGRL